MMGFCEQGDKPSGSIKLSSSCLKKTLHHRVSKARAELVSNCDRGAEFKRIQGQSAKDNT
jgi:hypothetical protein